MNTETKISNLAIIDLTSDKNELSLTDIISLVPKIIHYVEELYKKLKGPEKKAIVLQFFSKLINLNIKDKDSLQYLLAKEFIESNNLASLIDSIVAIGNSREFKKIKNSFFCKNKRSKSERNLPLK